MRLLSVDYNNFRNLKGQSLVLSPGTTVAVGANGQGKTNLLEGIFVLATLKALRARRLSELICFGEERGHVGGRLLVGGAERHIEVQITATGRTALVDGKRAASLETYFGGVSVVAFTPDDLMVVKGSPDERRTLLDRAVFNRFPAYLDESREYARALKARNRLLKDRAAPALLRAWDETLARVGARLWVRRRALLKELVPRATEAFSRVGRTEFPGSFVYAPAVVEAAEVLEGTEEALRAKFEATLDARLQRDMDKGFTSVGPHADDLLLSIGEHPARAFASQGQARALVIAWKMAEIENLHAQTGVMPMLLLDDVSSELDQERNAFLMQYLRNLGAQVFLTTTDRNLVAPAAHGETRWYEVERGTVRESLPR